jgi:hypothetical protein
VVWRGCLLCYGILPSFISINEMELTSVEYFFIEWLIIEKGMTEEKYNALTDKELFNLKKEYIIFCLKQRKENLN